MPSRRFAQLAACAVVLLTAGATSADAPANRYNATGNVIYDTKTHLNWDLAVSTSKLSWSAAKSLCAAHSGQGWRLPTVKELATLIDFSRQAGPTIDSHFLGTPSDKFWAATEEVGQVGVYAWFVDFSFPPAAFFGKEATLYWARCVR